MIHFPDLKGNDKIANYMFKNAFLPKLMVNIYSSISVLFHQFEKDKTFAVIVRYSRYRLYPKRYLKFIINGKILLEFFLVHLITM